MAERTSVATTEISRVVALIHEETPHTVGSMQAVTPLVEDSIRRVSEASSLLDAIASESSQSKTPAVDVVQATREQSSAAHALARIAADTNEKIRVNTSSAKHLEDMAQQRHKQVNYFKV